MFLPPEYFWLEPVLIAAAVVFVVDLFSNVITFGNTFVNALVTALIFGAIFGAVSYMGYADLRFALPPPA